LALNLADFNDKCIVYRHIEGHIIWVSLAFFSKLIKWDLSRYCTEPFICELTCLASRQVWHSANGIECVSGVTVCRAQLVLRWVTTGIPFQYVISQLNLLPSLG